MSVSEPRLSQILPVIRCSDCGKDVEFRLLGEHVCSSAPPMPALPPLPTKPYVKSGVSSGGYKPGYKPPPIPIANPTPSPSTSGSDHSPVSPIRSHAGSPALGHQAPGQRPSLPFLEKYAKKNKVGGYNGSPQMSAAQTGGFPGPDSSRYPQQPVSPTTPPNHNPYSHQHPNDQADYGSARMPYDDRHAQPTSTSGRYKAPPPPSSSQGRARIPNQDAGVNSFSTSPNTMTSSRMPSLPQKSNARTPSMASSSQGMGTSMDQPGRVRSPANAYGNEDVYGHAQEHGHHHGHSDSRDHDWERGMGNGHRQQQQQQQQYADQSPYHSDAYSGTSMSSNGFNRSGSSGSAASSMISDRSAGHYQRERSNTVLSERSERSVRSERSGRSERSRYADDERDSGRTATSRVGRHAQDAAAAAAAYKTPSPPISPKDESMMSGRGHHQSSAQSGRNAHNASYRPPTPTDGTSMSPSSSSPIPAAASSPSAPASSGRGRQPISSSGGRKGSGDQFDALMDDLMQEINVMPTSARERESSRSARSRSRPNVHEHHGRAASPPPTPGLPKIVNGTDSTRSQRSARGERSERSERSERDRERERDREHRSDRTVEREHHRSERDRDRSHRERDRSVAPRSTTRSRSAHRRGTTQHCEGCKHDILAEEILNVIQMSHGDYHMECFKCARCRRPLESARHAHEYEGRLLCEKDHQRMLEKEAQRAQGGTTTSSSRRAAAAATAGNGNGSSACAGCEGSIHSSEQVVYALGQSWHEHHLECYHCRQIIRQGPGAGHVEKAGRVYCRDDYAQLFLPKCRGCGLVVEKEAVCAQDGKLKGKWHAACFGCHTCKKPFPDKSFYVFGDAPYCRRHYHQLNNSLCKGCDDPIEGPCAQTMEGWRFHPGCFCCVECKVQLTDIYYNFENQAYCERDIMVIQRTQNVRAERRKTFFGKV